jgi:Xaa-Pro aminopeptidase
MSRQAPERGFPRGELERRVERAQARMGEAGIDALLLTTEPEFRYFTGFLTQFWQSPTRPWFLVLPRAGRPVAVIPAIGAALMGRTWIDDVRTWPSPQPADEGVSLLAQALRDVGAGTGRIGLPMGPETMLRMPLADYARLGEALPAATMVDASAILRSLRMIKSEAEIGKIAHVCRIASDTFAQVAEIAAAGQPLAETFRGFKMAMLGNGADDVPYLVGAAAPGGYDDIIAPPGRQPLAAGDVLMMDTGTVFDGYFCDFDRNYAIGHADDAAQRAYDTLYRATDAGLAAVRPGATSADLFRAMQEVIVADGYACGAVGRLGHGLGMQLTEWPSHTASDETVLEPGMVLTLEPGLEIAPGRGQVHEENLVVREDGAELLGQRAPRELPILA